MINSKNKKTRRIKLGLACLIAIAIILSVWGFNGGINMMSDNENTNLDGGLGIGLPPQVIYDNKLFRYFGEGDRIYKTLPEGYEVVAKTIYVEGKNGKENLTSSYGRAGLDIYFNPEYPYSIFMPAYVDGNCSLYTSAELWCDIIMYNNELYGNTAGISNWFNELPEEGGYHIVGKAPEPIFYKIPTEDFGNNMLFAVDGNVYINENEDVVFVEITESGGVHYVKLTKDNIYPPPDI